MGWCNLKLWVGDVVRVTLLNGATVNLIALVTRESVNAGAWVRLIEPATYGGSSTFYLAASLPSDRYYILEPHMWSDNVCAIVARYRLSQSICERS